MKKLPFGSDVDDDFIAAFTMMSKAVTAVKPVHRSDDDIACSFVRNHNEFFALLGKENLATALYYSDVHILLTVRTVHLCTPYENILLCNIT